VKKLKKASLKNGRIADRPRPCNQSSFFDDIFDRNGLGLPYEEGRMNEDSILKFACLSCTCRCILSSKAKVNFNSIRGGDKGIDSSSGVDVCRKEGGKSISARNLSDEEENSLAISIIMQMSAIFDKIKCSKLATILYTIVLHISGISTCDKMCLPSLQGPVSPGGKENLEEEEMENGMDVLRRRGGGGGEVSDVGTGRRQLSKYQLALEEVLAQSALRRKISMLKYTLMKSFSNFIGGSISRNLSNCFTSLGAAYSNGNIGIEIRTFSKNFQINYKSSSKFNSKFKLRVARMKAEEKIPYVSVRKTLSCLFDRRQDTSIYMYTNFDEADAMSSVKLSFHNRNNSTINLEDEYDDLAGANELYSYNYRSVFHVDILSSCVKLIVTSLDRQHKSTWDETDKVEYLTSLSAIKSSTSCSSSTSSSTLYRVGGGRVGSSASHPTTPRSSW
jgi:hypothetical protein